MSLLILAIGYSDINLTVIIVVGFILGVWLGYDFLHTRYKLFSDRTIEKVAIKFVLAILLIAEFLASSTGLDVILIVFILGILLAKYVDEHTTLKHEIETIGFGFLTPIFFFVTGYGISIKQLGSEIGYIAIILLVSFIATYLSTYLFAKKHFSKRAHIMGLLFNAPMSIGIVTATIGYDRGIVDDRLYSILIGAVLISSLVAIILGKYPKDLKSLTFNSKPVK